MVHDPRTRIVYDDARHFVLTTPEKFDIITSDPIHPWVKGTPRFTPREYFQLVQRASQSRRLRHPMGAPLRKQLETVQSEMATFFEVFPHGTFGAI